MSSDFCLICAEELRWTGVGGCGHQEICSRCVSRMRFVMRDNACPQCRADQPDIFITRHMGDFTARPGDFATLKDRAAKGELHHLASINAYFDDQGHYKEIESLCGYNHPIFSQSDASKGPSRPPPAFKSLNEMRRFIEHNFKQSFCEICIASRKVFLSEQILYTKQQLDRHNTRGDEEGPLAAESSGFKGHPICKFCKQRFYDGQELYKHMESVHEHCFLCRRTQPDKYVYYRHYAELEDHYRSVHHLCSHPSCLEKKFIVFKDDFELKRHIAQEHGDELKLTKAQRREASTLPVNLQFRDPSRGSGAGSSGSYGTDQEAVAAAERAAAMARPGVIMGGGAGFNSRHQPQHQRQQQGQQGMHHSRSDPQLNNNQGGAEMFGQGQGGPEDSVTFTPDDFPSVTTAYSSRAGSSIRQLATWAASGNAQRNNSMGASSSNAAQGQGLDAEAFPELPSLSKAQKKKLQHQQQSLAQRLVNSARPAQVLFRATPSAAPPPTPDDFPSLPAPPLLPLPPPPPASSGLNSKPGSSKQKMSLKELGSFQPAGPSPSPFPLPSPPAPLDSGAGSSASAAALFHSLSGNRSGYPLVPKASSQPPNLIPSASNDFPSLPSAPKGKAKKPPPSSPSPLLSIGQDQGLQAAFRAAADRAASSSRGQYKDKDDTDLPLVSTPGDFPSLPAPSPSTSAPLTNLSGGNKKKNSKAKPSPSNPPPPLPPPAKVGGPSEALREANATLIAKIKLQLHDDGKFSIFRETSSNFLRGNLDAKSYHSLLVDHGLVNLAAELASLCPDATRREALTHVHTSFLTMAAELTSSSSSSSSLVTLGSGSGGGGQKWIPPEAAAAMKNDIEAASSSWACIVCTLVNAPGAQRCEACGRLSPAAVERGEMEAFPALGPSSASSGQGESTQVKVPRANGKKGKGKGVVLSLGCRAGQGRNSAGFEPAPAPPPPAAWGSNQLR